MQDLKTHIKYNKHRPIVFHSIFWVCVFIALLFLFTQGKSPASIDMIYTGSFVLLAIIPVFPILYILIPRLLKKEHYVYFILSFIAIVGISTIFLCWFYEVALDKLLPNYYFISYPNTSNLMLLFVLVSILCVLIKLAEDWFYFNTNQNRLLAAKHDTIALQLNALRGQINPHFLFNALNVIYALALDNSKETTAAILKLSDILRYVLYDSDVRQVVLKDEIQLLERYIQFQQLRLENPDRVRLEMEIENENFPLYPMLLLPLVENSFKHGLQSDKGFIDIFIKQQNERLEVVVANDVFALSENTTSNKGIGLETIERNLNLVYPDVHEFTILPEDTTFTIRLRLNALS